MHTPIYLGEYTGCDHVYGSAGRVVVEAQAEKLCYAPWHLRSEPDIRWPGMSPDQHYTILILDVGFGKLQYLAYNFPHNPTVCHVHA